MSSMTLFRTSEVTVYLTLRSAYALHLNLLIWCILTICTLHDIFKFNRNESETVRGNICISSVLLFNAFLDCTADETLQKYLSKKFL